MQTKKNKHPQVATSSSDGGKTIEPTKYVGCQAFAPEVTLTATYFPNKVAIQRRISFIYL
jgi:hypothetical protein